MTFDLGKLVTRTVLKPEPGPRPVDVAFAGTIPMTLDLGSFVGNDLCDV